jgi:hypothetical protein
MCNVLLPPGVNPIAVNKHINTVEKYCSVRHATDDDVAHAHCMLDNSVYKHPLSMANTSYSSATTMVTRKLLNVRLYVYCLSCNCEGQCLCEPETKYFCLLI